MDDKEKEEAEAKAAEEAKAKEAAQGHDDAKDRDPSKGEDKAKVPDPVTISPLEEARALDKSIKEGTDKLKKLLEKNEKILADAMISGKGFAGQTTAQPLTNDEKWAIEASKRYEGTGMDPTTPIKEVTYS